MCMNRPGRVIAVDADGNAGFVDVRGRSQRVSLAVLAFQGTPAQVGDWVLLNAGIPVQRIDPQEAGRIIELMTDIEGAVP